MRGDRPQGTKLLIATIGLATVSYVGCGGPDHPPGNLMATPADPTETAVPDASATAIPSEDAPQPKPTDMPHGNLMPPPPPPPKQ